MGTESRTALFRAAAIALAVTAGACADGVAPTGSDADLARNSVIRVTPDSVVLTVGQRQQLGVADTGSAKRIQWLARDTAIATVTTDGVVQGRAVGMTYVIGKRTGSVDSAQVQVIAGTVTPPAPGDTTTTGGTTTPTDTSSSGGSAVTIASLTIDPSSASIDVDATVQLNAIAKDVSGNVMAATVTWSSANPSVASISSTGLVKGVAAGTAAITATADGKTS
jgi:alpha-amylase